ncbi:MAG: peptide chain release factor N(5)-glutamine methyltransferase, partial [Chloroflexi bacterium]|nr:peptide chain release factor N(5)-glutamine methyltransferase [Chloroflexota bacterium]
RVTPDTLIPRPETELLVDKALELASGRSIKSVADIGTGCGAIAIVLAVNLPRSEVYAIDLSQSALKIASENARRLGAAKRVRFLEGDLLEPLPLPVDLIAANLPYVTDAEMTGLADDVRLFEPRTALAGGPQGFDYMERLLKQAPRKLSPGGAILLEIGAAQGERTSALARKAFPRAMVEVVPDLGGRDRVVMIHARD